MSNMSKFLNGIQSEIKNEKDITENGATAYKTQGKALIDINFAVTELRGASNEDIRKKFSAAYFENPMLALRWLFFARDVRHGMGERRLFRVCLKWLTEMKPKMMKALIPVVAEYGREDDLMSLVDTPLCNDVFSYIKSKLEVDIKNMTENKPVSLLAKWCPSINTSSESTKRVAYRLIKFLGWSEKKYRKTLVALRKHIDVVEVKASSNKWSEIEYDKVPSKANLKYRNAFLRHDIERRREFLKKVAAGEEKINSSTNYPHDILHQYTGGFDLNPIDQTIEALWKALPDYVSGIDNGKIICVADGSGSMVRTVPNSNCTALEVANALAIYFAEKLTGPFKDKFITFSDNPQLIDMSNAMSLHDKAEIMLQHNEISSTDIEKVFDLLLDTAINNNIEQKDIPNVLILSDMNFNQGVHVSPEYNSSTLIEYISKKWEEHGLKLPRIIYWNICGGICRHAPVPVQKADNGITLVSGFSPSIASMVYSQKLDPFDVLVERLMTPRYDRIQELITEFI